MDDFWEDTIYGIKEFFKQFWCGITIGHEWETNGIKKGTMCDIDSWCKHCGKMYKP